MTVDVQNDGALLAEFIQQGSEGAFEELVRRHGPLVLGVCARVLRNQHDAEDAAQAVFLTLASKGRTLTDRTSVASWLHRVAWHVAMHAKKSKTIQKVREQEAGAVQGKRDDEQEAARKLGPALDGAIDNLPELYRAALVMHYLEGMSQDEAAAAIGCPRGTFSARLTRGRELLRERLARQQLIVPAVMLESVLTHSAASTLPTAKFLAATAKAAKLVSMGHALAPGAATPQVIALSKGAQSAMLIAKLKGAAAVIAAVVIVSAGATVAYRAIGADKGQAGDKPAADAPATQAQAPGSSGVVCNIKVVSDKVPDISSMEAWKKAYIKDGMTDEEKALAIWRTVATFQHQDSSVFEYIGDAPELTDALKVFNVYGHSYCGMAAAHSIELARYIGLEARGYTINSHVVPEIKWDNEWHLLDSSLIEYFPKPDKKIASIAEIVTDIKQWYTQHPEYWDGKHGIDQKLRDLQSSDGWTGWKTKGPEILKNCPTYDPTGWVPARSHGWYSQMQEYDGTCGDQPGPFLYEMGFTQGYQLNIQLRKGEKLTRNWSNKGLCMDNKPGCLNAKPTDSYFAYSAKMFGDLANGRIGNGTLEYNVPLATGEFRNGALLADNLISSNEDKNQDKPGPALHAKDAAKDGVLVIRMPSSYVYLTGKVEFKTRASNGGEVLVRISDNNGLDWKDVQKINTPGDQSIDLTPFVLRRYDYRLMFVLKGPVGIDSLKITHDIQHSQRPLPALDKGDNTLTFSAGTEGTITVEGSQNPASKGKQLMLADFHPVAESIPLEGSVKPQGSKGSLTFPVETPGDITRVRFGLAGRVHDKNDLWNLQISCDGGKTFKTVDTMKGPARFASTWVTFSDVPPGTRKVLVRYDAENAAAAMIFRLRIDADYKEPNGAFTPVKITYVYDEDGKEKQDVHTAAKADESYHIKCESKPIMKSITLELAE